MNEIRVINNGVEKLIKLPTFGNVTLTVQDGKVYRVETTTSEILKTK